MPEGLYTAAPVSALRIGRSHVWCRLLEAAPDMWFLLFGKCGHAYGAFRMYHFA